MSTSSRTVGPQAAAAPAQTQGVLLITSIPPQVELYREDTGAFFGTTPFFGFTYPPEKKLLPGDCSIKLLARRAGYIDSYALYSACGDFNSSSTVRLPRKPGDARDTRPAIRDSQPCGSERLKLGEALEGEDVDRVSQAWSQVSQCYFEAGRHEEAAYAMKSVTSVYEFNIWMPQDAKRKESADEGALQFRVAQLLWSRKESHKSLMKARGALRSFRSSKSEDDTRRVEAWVEERGSLADLHLEIKGMPDGPERTISVVILGKVEPPKSLAEAKAFPYTYSQISSGYLDTNLDFEDFPGGTYTICVEAHGTMAKAFGCQVMVHGEEGSKRTTIVIAAMQ